MTAKNQRNPQRKRQPRDRRDASEKAGFFRLETRARFKSTNVRS